LPVAEGRRSEWRASRRSAELLLLFAVLAWSFNFTALKYALSHGFSPLAFAPLRWVIAAVAFTVLTFRLEGSLRMARRDFLVVASAATVGICINQVVLLHAVDMTTASSLALVFGLLPVTVAVFSHVAGFESLRLRHWLGAGLSFGGVALVALGASGAAGGSLTGMLLGVIVVLSFAAYSVAIFPLTKRYSANRLNAVAILVATPLLFAAAAPALAAEQWSSIGGLAWGALLYSSLVGLVIGNGVWFYAIGRVGPGRASLYANLQPFFGAIFALALLSERLGLVQIVGGVVIGAAILLARSAGGGRGARRLAASVRTLSRTGSSPR
jgi:drug/metabolite transporter (DMT)-like permease